MASQLISRLQLGAEILHLQWSMLAEDLCQAREEIVTLDSKLLLYKIFLHKISVVDDTEESCSS